MFIILILIVIGAIYLFQQQNQRGSVFFEIISTKNLIDIAPHELDQRVKENLHTVLIDVRTAEEYKEGHIKGALLYPLGSEAQIAHDFAPDQELILICRSGQRTKIAVKILDSYQFNHLSHLQGGMEAWKRAHKPITKD